MSCHVPQRIIAAVLGAFPAVAPRTTHADTGVNAIKADGAVSSSAQTAPPDAAPISAARAPADDDRRVFLRDGSGYICTLFAVEHNLEQAYSRWR